MSTAARLGRFGAVTAAHAGVALVANAVTAGFLYRSLGAEFGVFALVSTGMLRLNLLEDSIGSYVITRVSSEREAANDVEPPEVALATALVATLVGALLVACAFALALFATYHARPDASALALVGGAGLLASSLAAFACRLLEGAEAYLPLRAIQTSVQAARLAAICAGVLFAGAGVVGLLALCVASYAVLALAAALVARGRMPSGVLRAVPRVGARSLRALVRFARPLLVAKGVAIASYRLDLWIVQLFVGPAGTAAYAVAEAVGGLVLHAIEVFKVLLPVSVRSFRAHDPGWVRRFVLGTSKAQVFVVGALAVALFANLETLLRVWFGDTPPAAQTAAALLLGFGALTAVRSSVQTILIGQQRFGAVERAFLVGGALNVAVSVAATWAFGAWGPALGTAVAGVWLLFGVTRAAGSALGLPDGTLERELVAPSVAALCAGAVLGALPLPPTGLGPADLVLRSALAAAAFASLFWAVVLDAPERRWISTHLLPGRAR